MTEPAPFWDSRHVKWVFNPTTELWHPPLGDLHPPVVGPGAVAPDRQPTYGSEPRGVHDTAAEIAKELGQE